MEENQCDQKESNELRCGGNGVIPSDIASEVSFDTTRDVVKFFHGKGEPNYRNPEHRAKPWAAWNLHSGIT